MLQIQPQDATHRFFIGMVVVGSVMLITVCAYWVTIG